MQALLRRIGLKDPPPPTAEGLRRVHRAYVERVPYEDLTVQLGESEPLDVARLTARILHGGRGGYCFEINGVFAALLEWLGFRVTRHEAVVGERGSADPTNHLALVVEAGGRRWLAEAGYGEGWVEPLPLEPGVHHTGPGPFTWRVQELDGGWWIGQHAWGATPGMTVAAPVVTLDAFAPHHERLSTSPDSPFVRTLVVQRPSDDRIVTLRARTLTVRGPGVDERVVLGEQDAFAAVLRERFGVDPVALGPERLGRLWRAACEQHEAWLRDRAAA